MHFDKKHFMEFTSISMSTEQIVLLRVTLDENGNITEIVPSKTDITGKPYIRTDKDMNAFESFAMMMVASAKANMDLP